MQQARVHSTTSLSVGCCPASRFCREASHAQLRNLATQTKELQKIADSDSAFQQCVPVNRLPWSTSLFLSCHTIEPQGPANNQPPPAPHPELLHPVPWQNFSCRKHCTRNTSLILNADKPIGSNVHGLWARPLRRRGRGCIAIFPCVEGQLRHSREQRYDLLQLLVPHKKVRVRRFSETLGNVIQFRT